MLLESAILDELAGGPVVTESSTPVVLKSLRWQRRRAGQANLAHEPVGPDVPVLVTSVEPANTSNFRGTVEPP